MSKKIITLISAMTVATFMMTGCGQSDQANKEQKENVAKEAKEEKKSEDTGTKDTAGNSSDYSKLISYMEKETEGKTKILYENKDPQVHKLDDVSVSMNNYTLVELNDFHNDFSIPFKDQTNGGVILAHYSVKNDSNKDVYYMPNLDISFTGAEKIYTNYRYLLPEEEQLSTKLSPNNHYLVKAGETVSGYAAYPFSKDDLTKILALSTVSVDIPVAQAGKDKVDTPIGSSGKFPLSLNKQGAEKIANDKAFYQDKVTFDNMGEKKMLKDKSNINKSQNLAGVNVTLDGYQFTQFTPNAAEAPRFENFKHGITLLTAKFKVDNKGSEDISLTSLSSKLNLNDNTQYTFNEGMLLKYSYNDLIKAGASGELLQIYTLDQEQYEKIWKDKNFEIELGPMRNNDGKDISKGKT
ncbi:MAG: DUF5068 domain-containing protein, partial [Bacillaceae bacterium]